MAERDDQQIPDAEATDEDDLVDEELLAEFLAEWDDHVRVCEQALLELESDPEDRPALDAVFRAFHSIKGAAGFLGQEDLRDLAHRVENLFDRARRNEIRMTGPAADVALAAVDAVRWYIRHLRGESDDGRTQPPGLERLLDAIEDPSGWSPPDGPVGSGDAGRAGDADSPPAAATADDGAASAEHSGVEPAGASADDAEPEGGSPVARDAAPSSAGPGTPPGVSAPRAPGGPGAAGPRAATGADETVRVRVDRLDTLVNRVGELVLAQSMLAQSPAFGRLRDPVVDQAMGLLGRVSRELQDLAMSMRMVPLDATFSRMRRVVRDLVRRIDRRVQLVVRGADTEIDRGMVELVLDPLVHVLRNAVDHGIEPPAERRAAGKPEVGRITLEACHADGEVVITVTDDGRGVDTDRVLARARERGLLPEGHTPTHTEILELLFSPGFSTAEQVSDVSGRGVGMDVVRRNIEAAHGRIEIESERGAGSTVRLRLPLTMAIVDGMILRVGTQRYVMPTQVVDRVVHPAPGQIRAVPGRGEVLHVQDELMPLVRMHEVFGIHGAERDAGRAVAVVTTGSSGRTAILVDDLLGKHQVVIKPLSRCLQRSRGIAGAAILADGRVGLVVDPEGIRRESQRRRRARAAAPRPRDPAATAPGCGPSRLQPEECPVP